MDYWFIHINKPECFSEKLPRLLLWTCVLCLCQYSRAEHILSTFSHSQGQSKFKAPSYILKGRANLKHLLTFSRAEQI